MNISLLYRQLVTHRFTRLFRILCARKTMRRLC